MTHQDLPVYPVNHTTPIAPEGTRAMISSFCLSPADLSPIESLKKFRGSEVEAGAANLFGLCTQLAYDGRTVPGVPLEI